MTGAYGEAVRAAAAPVLDLFRRILRAHRSLLPPPMRPLGDAYVREEFRQVLQRGKTTTEAQWHAFFNEWDRYVGMLRGTALSDVAGNGSSSNSGGGGGPLMKEAMQETPTGTDAGGELSAEALAAMSPDQRSRVEKLRQATAGLGKGLLSKK
jgi:hypothetical protein